MATETGGSAFPYTRLHSDRGEEWQETEEGMTLRDYLAAKAMEALMHPKHFIAQDKLAAADGEALADRISRAAYMQADAMLAARSAP
jgi:hypothetical protein